MKNISLLCALQLHSFHLPQNQHDNQNTGNTGNTVNTLPQTTTTIAILRTSTKKQLSQIGKGVRGPFLFCFVFFFLENNNNNKHNDNRTTTEQTYRTTEQTQQQQNNHNNNRQTDKQTTNQPHKSLSIYSEQVVQQTKWSDRSIIFSISKNHTIRLLIPVFLQMDGRGKCERQCVVVSECVRAQCPAEHRLLPPLFGSGFTTLPPH